MLMLSRAATSFSDSPSARSLQTFASPGESESFGRLKLCLSPPCFLLACFEPLISALVVGFIASLVRHAPGKLSYRAVSELYEIVNAESSSSPVKLVTKAHPEHKFGLEISLIQAYNRANHQSVV